MSGGLNGPYPFGANDSPEIFHQTSIQFEDTAILTHGTHNMKAGFQFIRYRNDYVPSTTADGAAGQIGFNGTYSGNAETDFVLGLPYYMGYSPGFSSTVGQRSSAIGAYFQDDWKLRPNLTLNLGLRWQLFTPIADIDNRETNIQEYTGQIELAGVNGVSSAMYNQYNGIANFLPRVGIAWNPGGSLFKNTVVRAAFSRSSFQEGTGEYNRLATNPPWNQDLSGTWGGGANGAIPANQVTLDQGFAGLGTAGTCTLANVTSAPPACFAGLKIHMTDPNYRPAVSNQWNFSIQRQLTSSTTFQAGYVGQHTDHLAMIVNAGQGYLDPQGQVLPSPFLAGNPALVAAGASQVRLNTTEGQANYDALQLVFQQRLSHGLSVQANYTWSKCLTNNNGYYGRYGDSTSSQSSGDIAFPQNTYDVNNDYGPCYQDLASVFSGYVTYELPFGKGRQFGANASPVLDAVLGGWEVDAIYTFHGGFPISMQDWGGDAAGTGSFDPRPSCTGPSIPTPYTNNPTANGGGYVWFSEANMVSPTTGFGNCGFGTERGPGLKTVDVSLSKKFTIPRWENQYLQFKAQAINTFNTPILDVVGYSADIFPSSAGGVINTSEGARNLQLALKYVF